MTTINPEWAYKGRELLAEHAAVAQDTITYGLWHDAMAPLCDWPLRSAGYSWVNNYTAPTLYEIAHLNKVFEEPLLPALVRQSKPGSPIGEGFAGAVRERYGLIPEDLQAFARVEAGRCFAHFAKPK